MATTSIGSITGWELKQGYPKFSGSGPGDESVTYVFYVPPTYYTANKPNYGAGCPDPMHSNFLLSGLSFNTLEDGTLEATLTYRSPQSNYQSHQDGETQISLSVSPMEKDIQYHPNYLAMWNHFLVFKPKQASGSDDTTGTTSVNVEPIEVVPDGWNILKVPVVLGKKYWRFVRSQAEAPEGWIAFANPTKKPGLQSYVVPCPVVTQKVFYTTYNNAQSACDNGDVGTWSSPSKTFGKSDGYWLVMGVECSEEGKYWVVQTRFQYSTIKDDDIYPVPEDTSGGNLSS